ncbi:hypothetical protein GF325_16700 [Candidatus Bathyarchaeota archaeon]|nr:hypothetical protein [Candidatus Bathyarchaeota archaeon]
MPDWIAHLMLAFTITTVLNMEGAMRVIFLVGNVMPDLVRSITVVAEFLGNDVISAFVAYPLNVGSHSLLGVFAWSLLLSAFFQGWNDPDKASSGSAHVNAIPRKRMLKEKIRGIFDEPFLLFFAGGACHLFLDTFMWPFAGGIPWLFPLNQAAFIWSFRMLWPTTWHAIATIAPFFIISVAFEVHFAWEARQGITRNSSQVPLGQEPSNGRSPDINMRE